MYRLLLAALAAAFVAAAPTSPHKPLPRAGRSSLWTRTGPNLCPDKWMLGQVAGIAVDNKDNVWIIHRPSTLVDDEKGAQKTPPETRCCIAAPPVLQFSPDGKLLRSWGGPGQGFDWPKTEHGIHVDKAGNVWIAGNDNDDHQILKFTPEGKFLMQIGKAGSTGGSNSPTQLGRPAHMVTDDAARSSMSPTATATAASSCSTPNTGAYKRHWGAYGTKQPTDEKLPPYKPVASADLSKSFSNPVHCVRLSRDGLVYVCDRANDRIQVFKKDGTFVSEFQVEPQTLQNGSVWDLVLSEDRGAALHLRRRRRQHAVIILDRQTGKRLGSFCRPGRMAGELKWVHNMADQPQGQHLHRRSRHRPAGAEVQTGGRMNSSKAIKQLSSSGSSRGIRLSPCMPDLCLSTQTVPPPRSNAS